MVNINVDWGPKVLGGPLKRKQIVVVVVALGHYDIVDCCDFPFAPRNSVMSPIFRKDCNKIICPPYSKIFNMIQRIEGGLKAETKSQNPRREKSIETSKTIQKSF